MRYILSSVTVLVFLLAACQSTDNNARVMEQQQAQNTPDDQVAFWVDGKATTIEAYQQRLDKDLSSAIQRFLAQGLTLDDIEAMAQEQHIHQLVLDRMIQEELLLYMASKEDVGVDAAAVDAEVVQQAEMMAAQKGVPELSAEDMVALRAETARQNIVLQMIASHTISDSFHSRHILVDDEATAQQVMDELQGGKPFEDAAQEFSKDPGSAANGGDLGWVGRGMFVPEFETTAMSPSVKLNTPVVVQSQFGYHIIEVLERASEPFGGVEELRSSMNPGAYIDATFVPWYDQFRAESERNGLLTINEAFDPTTIPLPFPDELPEPPDMPHAIELPDATDDITATKSITETDDMTTTNTTRTTKPEPTPTAIMATDEITRTDAISITETDAVTTTE